MPSISTRKRMLRNGSDAERSMQVLSSATASSARAFDPLVRKLEELDDDFVTLGVEVANDVLDRPRLTHDEPALIGTTLILHDDDDLSAIARQLSRDDLPVPLVKLQRLRHALLQRDVAVLREPGQLAGVRWIGSLAVLDHVGSRCEGLHLAETGCLKAVNFETEAEVTIRIGARHDPLPSRCEACTACIRRRFLPRPRRVLKFRQPARIRAAIRLDLARDCPRTASECSSGGRAGVGQVGAWYRLNPLHLFANLAIRDFQIVLRLQVLPKLCTRPEVPREPQRHLIVLKFGSSVLGICADLTVPRLSIMPLAMALCTRQWPLVAFGLRWTAAQRSPGRCRCP